MKGYFFIKLKKQHKNINSKVLIKEKINFYPIIIIIINSIIISSNSSINYNDLNESIYSYITLRIGKGNFKVYSSNYDVSIPNIVYINEINQTTFGPIYNFKESINSVILIWKNPITDCENMFQYCDKIIEIDLTHFDTSQVTNMHNMFDGCKNLKYLNISNINTSKVENMGKMFQIILILVVCLWAALH